MRKHTMIKKGSVFDWKEETKRKILYKLENVKPCEPFTIPGNAIRKGYTYAIIPD